MDAIHNTFLDGFLLTWGDNSHGQLGIGQMAYSKGLPYKVKSLLGLPLVEISAGGYHCMILTMSGAVFGWGKNRLIIVSFIFVL